MKTFEAIKADESCDIMSQIAASAATHIKEEIDWMIQLDLLRECGWTLITLATLGNNKNAIDIREWMDKYCFGECLRHGREFLFKENSMAMLFILRWA